jgi:hypothetical protein
MSSLCTSRHRASSCRDDSVIFLHVPACADTAVLRRYWIPTPPNAGPARSGQVSRRSECDPLPAPYAKRDQVAHGIRENRPPTSHLTRGAASSRRAVDVPACASRAGRETPIHGRTAQASSTASQEWRARKNNRGNWLLGMVSGLKGPAALPYGRPVRLNFAAYACPLHWRAVGRPEQGRYPNRREESRSC